MGGVRIFGIDTGETMTDRILVDSKGCFALGRAQTVLEDESRGIDKSTGCK